MAWFFRRPKASPLSALARRVGLAFSGGGARGLAHGGASAALLDQAMSAAVWRAGYIAAAVKLEVGYRRPMPLGQPIQVEGSVVEKDGRAV